MRIGVSLPVREMQNDLTAFRDFAQSAEALGYTHLRVPEQIIRPGNGHLFEPITMMTYIAAITQTIELVPSVVILPARQTALLAKQIASLDVLSGGRVRLGIGVGGSEEEYTAQGQDFHTRGARCNEQMALLKLLWTQETVDFQGKWDTIQGAGLHPLPIPQPLPVGLGARSGPGPSVINRIGTLANGWFVLCSPEEFPEVSGAIGQAAQSAGRNPKDIGTEAGVAVVGPREAEWQDRVRGWQQIGLTHLCLRTLGGDLTPQQHLDKLAEVVEQIPR